MSDSLEGEKAVGQVETSRRRFLKAAGKMAVYTPPAMLLMSKPSFATFSKTGGNQHYYYPRLHHRFRHHFSNITKKFNFRRYFWHGRDDD